MSKKRNLPKLRFPEFRDSGEWEEKRLGEITLLLTNGFVGKAKDHYTNSSDGIIYIQGYNITANGFNLKGIKKVTQEFHKKNSKSVLQKDDLLTIQTGDIGVTAQVPEHLVGSNCHALVISRFKIELAKPGFYCQLFNSHIGKRMFKRIETGSTMKHLNVGHLTELQLPLPSLPEQQRIADCLTSLDEVISNETAKLEAYKSHKKGLMQKLFPGEGELVPEWRFPEFQNSGEWEEKRLGELGNLKNGANFSSNKKGSGILTVDVLNMYGTGIEIKLHSLYRVDIEGGDYHLEEGDILFVRSSLKKDGVGWASIFTGFNEQIIYCGFLIRFRLNSHNNHKPVFLLYFFRSDIGREKIISLSGTGGITNISQNSLSTLSVPLPSLPEQQKIADCLTSLDDLISAQASKIEKLKLHKKGLMQGLFPAGDEG